MNRADQEAFLNSVRDTEPDIWITLPKPAWYMEKYNCYPRRLTLMEAYSRAYDNSHSYSSNTIETRESNAEFPDLPKPETETLLTIKTEETKEEIKEATTD